jgi:hypothetical protein
LKDSKVSGEKDLQFGAKEGLNCKSGGPRFELEFLFEIQGPRCKVEAEI